MLSFITIALIVDLPYLLQARNPFVENQGVADPHLHVFNDTVYAFATHDFSPKNTHFRMDDWWVWKSQDLVDWERVSVLKPKDTPADPSEYEKCYATDAAYRDGEYWGLKFIDICLALI